MTLAEAVKWVGFIRRSIAIQGEPNMSRDLDALDTILMAIQFGGEAAPEPTGNDGVRATVTGLTDQAAKCDEPAKPEVGPMRNAESPSGVQALGSSGLAASDRLRAALATFRARKPEPTLTSYSAHAVNRLIEAIEEALGKNDVG
jgi:hypothetical protein